MGKKLKIFFLLAASLLVVQGVSAAPLPEGGDGFDDAIELNLNQTYDREITGETTEYFYIEGINAGQIVNLQGYYSKGDPDCGLILNMYNEDRNKVGFEFYDQGFDLNWLPNSEQNTYSYYIQMENSWCPVNLEELEISAVDAYDADSTTDAGPSFDDALKVEEGSYTGWMSGDSGTDELDIYSTQVNEGEKISIELTPDPEEGYEIKFYDQDRNQVAQTRSENAGAITRLSHRSEQDQTMYIQIIESYQSSLAEYSFEISKTVPEAAELTVEAKGAEGKAVLGGEAIDKGYKELDLEQMDSDTWSTTVEIQPERNYAVEFQPVSGYESPDLSDQEKLVNLEPGESTTITGTYVAEEGSDTSGTGETSEEPSNIEESVISQVMEAIGVKNILLIVLIPVVIFLLLAAVILGLIYFLVKKLR